MKRKGITYYCFENPSKWNAPIAQIPNYGETYLLEKMCRHLTLNRVKGKGQGYE